LFADGGAAHLSLFRRLFAWGLALGVVGTVLVAVRRSSLMADYELTLPAQLALVVASEIGVLGLTAAYVSAIVLAMDRAALRRCLTVLAPVGRMPLTTYVMQSIVGTFVFYGWGLGYTGEIGSAGCLAIAIAIFALQVVASHLWLRRFRFGPLEWLWRTLVYRRIQPML
jgi:uncharacterized protein